MMSDSPLGVCPDCKTAISRLASSCPKCGRPISEGDLLDLSNYYKPSPWGCARTFQWGCFIIIGLIVLLVIYGILNATRITDEDRMRQLEKMEKTGRNMYR